MDFETVLRKLISAFEKNNINYALIGGFALGLYGVVRSTNDLDFLIDKKSQTLLKEFMAKNGYKIIHESDNVIQFENIKDDFGSIDFLYAYREPSLQMLKRAIKEKLFKGEIILKVLIPEDIIGLKVQSFVNNPERKVFDLDDITNLMRANRNLRWDIMNKHFELFDLKDLFQDLKDKYGKK